jgi:hypothetical protein
MAFVDKGPAPKGGQYLVCDRARRGLDCCRAFIKYGELEQLVLTHCKGLRPRNILNENDDTTIALLKGELDGKAGELNSINTELENISDSVSTTPDKRVRAMLENQMAERFDRQASLKQQMDHIKQQIDTLSRSFEDTQLTLDSLKELLVFLNTTETKKRIEVRLKVRNEIRKLISRIDVYPAGHIHFTIETAKEALKSMSMVHSEDEDPEGYAWLKENLRQRVENPKDFRLFSIKFISGSMRTIIPESKLPVKVDFDKEERVLRIWNEMPNGRIICEEYLEDGIRVRNFRRSMESDNEEVLQEILDRDCEDANRLARQALRVIDPI